MLFPSRLKINSRSNKKVRQTKKRGLRLESLEDRRLLSVATASAGGEAPVGHQPTGALTGKIVYTSGGHGWTADNLGDASWGTQRPELFEMVEDFGNQDQMTLYVDYLFNAGATVVPMRPVGHQENEVVLDNDDADVTFVGNWINSSSSVFYGDAGDLPYRYAATSTSETAYARYQPDIPEAGNYPVYAWTRAGSDRASDQLYRINHSGGTTEVTVNHRMVGGGLVYLGTYHFEAGQGGYVDISNRSDDAGKIVVADAIRFGNGMGDIDRGGGISGHSREDEAALYWITAHVGQGTSSSAYRSPYSSADSSSTIRSPILWASHMNRESEGSPEDRVYLGFHSNASSGTARGTMALYNSGSGNNTATPHQQAWADMVASELNNDMSALGSPPLEYDWVVRSSTTYGSSYGEIDNRVIDGEFDATIIEIAFHDNSQDAKLMRDPVFRDLAARSMCQATVEYFSTYGSVATTTLAPNPVTNVSAISSSFDAITVSWDAPAIDGIGGHATSGYMVYTSTNGRGFDGGRYVVGGSNCSFMLTDVDATDGVRYFKVTAVNAGGQASDSEVVAARPKHAYVDRVLIVNGFDRLDRYQNTLEAYGSGTIQRVRPQWSNSFDYAVQTAEAIESYAAQPGIDTVQNEAVIGGEVNLSDYHTVIWISGEESSADKTFDATEQTLVTQFINGGGNLFVSGAEIGFELVGLNRGKSFYENTLHTSYISDDAGTYAAAGTSWSIFAGITLTFDNGTDTYNVDYPDVIGPRSGGATALTYTGGVGGGAATQYQATDAKGSQVVFGFPFETITSAATRAQIMDRVLEFFDLTATPALPGDSNRDGIVNSTDAAVMSSNWLQEVDLGPFEGDFNNDGIVNAIDATLLAVNWQRTISTAKQPSIAVATSTTAAVTTPVISQPAEPASFIGPRLPVEHRSFPQSTTLSAATSARFFAIRPILSGFGNELFPTDVEKRSNRVANRAVVYGPMLPYWL